MSPPSWATAGRTRVSISSRICLMIASSSSPAPSSSSAASGADDRIARHVVLHDRAEHRGLEHVPVLTGGLGDGDEVRPEEHAGHAVDLEQAARERRGCGILRFREVRHAAGHHLASGQELQGRRVRRLFGLDEHVTIPSWLARDRPWRHPGGIASLLICKMAHAWPRRKQTGAGSLEQDVGDLSELRARAQQEEALGRQMARHELSIGLAVDDHPRL